MIGVGAAQEEAGDLARAAVTVDLHAGLGLQQVGDGLCAGALDLFALDDCGVADDGFPRLRDAAGGDDDVPGLELQRRGVRIGGE